MEQHHLEEDLKPTQLIYKPNPLPKPPRVVAMFPKPKIPPPSSATPTPSPQSSPEADEFEDAVEQIPGCSGAQLLTSQSKQISLPISFQRSIFRNNNGGDLQSRLKIEKVLGVRSGAKDKSGVHGSKILQILGCDDHLFTKLPSGLNSWLIFVASSLIVQSVYIIFVPSEAGRLGLLGVLYENGKKEGHYYAVSTFGMVFHVWRYLGSKDKEVMKFLLNSTIFHFSSLMGADAIGSFVAKEGFWNTITSPRTYGINIVRLVMSMISGAFVSAIGGPHAGVRPPSHSSSVDNLPPLRPKHRTPTIRSPCPSPSLIRSPSRRRSPSPRPKKWKQRGRSGSPTRPPPRPSSRQ